MRSCSSPRSAASDSVAWLHTVKPFESQITRQTCSSTVGVSWLRCGPSSATICAHYESTNCRVQLVLIHLSLRPNCQVFRAPRLLLLQNNWNCIMCTIPSLQWWISMILFSFWGGTEPVGTRWWCESNTAHSVHTPSVELYDSIICFLRRTFSSTPPNTHQ